MTERAESRDARDLRELWHQYARATSDARLATLAAVGLVGVVGFTALLFVDVTRVARWWPLVLPAAFAGAFGVWGIADREIAAPQVAAGDATARTDQCGARRGWLFWVMAGFLGLGGRHVPVAP